MPTKAPPNETLCPVTPSVFASTRAAQAFATRARQNVHTAAALRAATLNREADAVAACSVTDGAMFCSGCGKLSYHTTHCKTRLCAFCAPVLTARRADTARAAIALMARPKWITLTMERKPALRPALQFLRKAFKKWRKSPTIKDRLRGGLYKLEAVPKPDGWHVHLHMVADCLYIPVETIWQTWAAALGQPRANVHVCKVNSSIHARDLAKYAAKLDAIEDWPASQLREYVVATQGQRLWQCFGTFYNRKELRQCFKPEAPQMLCPHCGKPRSLFPITAGFRVFGHDWPEVYKAIVGSQPLKVPSARYLETQALVSSTEAQVTNPEPALDAQAAA